MKEVKLCRSFGDMNIRIANTLCQSYEAAELTTCALPLRLRNMKEHQVKTLFYNTYTYTNSPNKIIFLYRASTLIYQEVVGMLGRQRHSVILILLFCYLVMQLQCLGISHFNFLYWIENSTKFIFTLGYVIITYR